jgi:hypothetical protein
MIANGICNGILSLPEKDKISGGALLTQWRRRCPSRESRDSIAKKAPRRL